jgi:hypothetical protein
MSDKKVNFSMINDTVLIPQAEKRLKSKQALWFFLLFGPMWEESIKQIGRLVEQLRDFLSG